MRRPVTPRESSRKHRPEAEPSQHHPSCRVIRSRASATMPRQTNRESRRPTAESPRSSGEHRRGSPRLGRGCRPVACRPSTCPSERSQAPSSRTPACRPCPSAQRAATQPPATPDSARATEFAAPSAIHRTTREQRPPSNSWRDSRSRSSSAHPRSPASPRAKSRFWQQGLDPVSPPPASSTAPPGFQTHSAYGQMPQLR